GRRVQPRLKAPVKRPRPRKRLLPWIHAGPLSREPRRTKRRRLTAAVEAFLARRPHLDFEEVSFSIAVLEQQRLRWVHDAFDAESLC
ncbi:MAG: hypothetical protein AAFV53_33120, partial [Myxococcota bacterium]